MTMMHECQIGSANVTSNNTPVCGALLLFCLERQNTTSARGHSLSEVIAAANQTPADSDAI
jgi:hypothetical protein